jgi:hypothetical protein
METFWKQTETTETFSKILKTTQPFLGNFQKWDWKLLKVSASHNIFLKLKKGFGGSHRNGLQTLKRK